MGFARLAVEHGYTIVPFAAVGAEEAVDIVLDGDNPLLAPTRLFVEKVLGSRTRCRSPAGSASPPFRDRNVSTTGSANGSRPRRSRGRQDDDAVVRAVREQTKKAVEQGMEFLLAERENDPNRSVIRRLLGPERR